MPLSLTVISLRLPFVSPEGVLSNRPSSFDNANNTAGKQVQMQTQTQTKYAVTSKNNPIEEQNQEIFSSAVLVL